MTKNEFLDILGRRLAQTFPQEKVAEHIRYYDEYLTGKTARGMAEEEAVEQLGDPLLIARTLMDTSEDYGNRNVIYEEAPEADSGWSVETEKDRSEKKEHQLSIRGRGGCLLAAIICIVVLLLVLWLVGSVLSILLPVLIPVLVIVMVISYFKQR